MHNTPEQNEAFRKTWDTTNARWKAQQKAYEADPVAYKKQIDEMVKAQKEQSQK